MNDLREALVKTVASARRKLHAVSAPGIARTDAETARLAKALGHPARVAIVRMLVRRGECVCGAIVEGLPLSQATVSQHLKVLKQAGLIHGEIDGPRVCYCINPEAVNRLKSLLDQL
jgi:ArsR family transcriptional regulator